MGMNDRQYRKQKEERSEPAFRFIDYRLGKKDHEWLSKADCETEFPFSLVDELLVQGYKISESYDRRNHTYMFSVTDRDPQSAGYNACITGRGATRFDSWVSFAYRHYVVAGEDWHQLETKAAEYEPARWS